VINRVVPTPERVAMDVASVQTGMASAQPEVLVEHHLQQCTEHVGLACPCRPDEEEEHLLRLSNRFCVLLARQPVGVTSTTCGAQPAEKRHEPTADSTLMRCLAFVSKQVVAPTSNAPMLPGSTVLLSLEESVFLPATTPLLR